MNNFTEWLHTGESEDGKLQVWCKIDTIDDEKYLKVKYVDENDKIVGAIQNCPTKKIELFKSLIDCYRMEYGYDI